MARAYKDRNGPKTRQQILEAVQASPGVTKTELTHSVGLAWGTVHYHLRLLLAERQLVVRLQYGWNRIYPPHVDGPQALPLLRAAPVGDIMEIVRQRPGSGIQAVSVALGLSRKVVRRHLARLVEGGVLRRTPDWRPRFFVLEPKQLALARTMPSESQLPDPKMSSQTSRTSRSCSS